MSAIPKPTWEEMWRRGWVPWYGSLRSPHTDQICPRNFARQAELFFQIYGTEQPTIEQARRLVIIR